MNKQVSAGRLRAGRSIINQNQNGRIFKRGTLMFIEGESSAEMFIVRTGKVRILKQEGENTLELAVLGPGSVLGELSLLDNQPRSATAQVIEDTVVTVIDEDLFRRTLQGIPNWLRELIGVITGRLRDTMKRCSNDIVNNSISGVIRIILTLNESEGTIIDNSQAIPLRRVKDTIYSVTGLGGNETETILLHLILKEMILIRKDMMNQEYIIIKQPDICSLYMAYLRARQCGRKLTGEDFSEELMQLIEAVYGVGERSGKKEGEKLKLAGLEDIVGEVNRKGNPNDVNQGLKQLVDAKLIMIKENIEFPDNKQNGIFIVYNAESLKRICCLRKWLNVFGEEIRY